jgi:2,3,4,5-tetrahydropyridine-2-carboxylate N-succinyltransferase
MRLSELESFFSRPIDDIVQDGAAAGACGALLQALENGESRAATRMDGGAWRTNTWVKTGILSVFRLSALTEYPAWPGGAVDKSAFPPRVLTLADGVRVVPGGTSVRRGSRICPGAVFMPPSFVNVGAWVGAGTMVDSHALVGSCAQIGERVHLSAGVQVGGVLEPAGALPVIVEDGCFLGALSGLFEGVVMKARAVLAPGVLLTASTTVYDLVEGRELKGEIPEAAVVVPGTRPAKGDWAVARGLSLYAPCIVKYRDAGTDAATALEAALR